MDDNGQKRSVNTKIVTVFIFFIGNGNSEMEIISVLWKRKFGTENTSVTVEI
jgi:hypothetical protein